ncbi:MAG: serine--tRNA ligase [Elusimicrobiota bacterium]
MIDIKLLRSSPEYVKKAILSRSAKNLDLIEKIFSIDASYRKSIQEAEALRNERNAVSKEISSYKIAKKEPPAELVEKAAKIKEAMSDFETKAQSFEKELEALIMTVPNLPQQSVPLGNSEADNKQIYEDIYFKKEFSFKPSDHHEIGEKLGIIDFERAAKLSGARFSMLKGKGARLERAIAQFMLDSHAQNGYEEILPPFLVNSKTMTGTGQLPKFEEDLYKTAGENPLYLIPTAEVPLTNIFSGEILEENSLPLKFTAHTPCFRQEAGSYGKDTRGLIRNHQFNKVELVWITAQEHSAKALDEMLSHASGILKALKIPYRIIELCTADLGFSSSKTYDIEVWMPSENRYREISSCSNCLDFQARRMNLRYRPKGDKPKFAHTLNGSGLAVGRTFAAVLENYQKEDGSVEVPEVLRKYTGFDRIG